MKMEETNRTFADDEGEETMVTPRFDNEETVLARPVVPFEEVADAPEASATAAPPQPLYTRLRAAPRRSLVAALVLASVLVGSALGVGGLYFYQKHRNADATPADVRQQADATAPAAQPTAEAEPQSRETSAATAAPSSPAPAASEPKVRADDEADSAKEKGSEKDKSSEKADDSPVVARRNVSEDRDSTVTPKHGKKGERDEEIHRESRRSNRDDDEDRAVRSDDSDDDRREARRVGVITYRPRRARQRRDNYGTPDRLRRIFEGQP
jgi:hypothetical protein